MSAPLMLRHTRVGSGYPGRRPLRSGSFAYLIARLSGVTQLPGLQVALNIPGDLVSELRGGSCGIHAEDTVDDADSGEQIHDVFGARGLQGKLLARLVRAQPIVPPERDRSLPNPVHRGIRIEDKEHEDHARRGDPVRDRPYDACHSRLGGGRADDGELSQGVNDPLIEHDHVTISRAHGVTPFPNALAD